jgi:hypothetical protein
MSYFISSQSKGIEMEKFILQIKKSIIKQGMNAWRNSAYLQNKPLRDLALSDIFQQKLLSDALLANLFKTYVVNDIFDQPSNTEYPPRDAIRAVLNRHIDEHLKEIAATISRDDFKTSEEKTNV